MRAVLTAAFAAAAIAVFAEVPSAAAGDAAPWPNATPLPRFADFFRHYDYRPACPYGYYFDCRVGPLGHRQCACWRDIWRSY